MRFLETLAALLAGIVEKGRLQAEAEAQVDSLRAIDAARASLVTIVTHELRTPLAVVRASLELIGGGRPPTRRATDAARWETEALRQVDRLDSMVDSILASLRVLREEPQRLEPIDVAAVVDGIFERLGSILRRHQLVATFDERPLLAVGSSELLGRLLEYLLENAPSTRRPAAGSRSSAGATAAECCWRSPMTGRASRPSGGSGSSSRSCAATTPRAGPGSACSPRVTWPGP